VSSTQQIQAVRKFEQRFPADLAHNGRQYIRGYKVCSATIRQLRDIRRGSMREGATCGPTAQLRG
jgi:hypothetical protein